jgi:hypothetical protein
MSSYRPLVQIDGTINELPLDGDIKDSLPKEATNAEMSMGTSKLLRSMSPATITFAISEYNKYNPPTYTGVDPLFTYFMS